MSKALQGRITDLATRIEERATVEAPSEAPTEARFGTTVAISAPTGETKGFTIVRVDEVDPGAG